MKHFIVCAGIVLTLLVFCASQAEARIFEPQPNWWRSGRTCIDTRTPPGLAWDGLPARACVARIDAVLRKLQSETPGKDEGYSLASAELTSGELGSGELARGEPALAAKLTDKPERA